MAKKKIRDRGLGSTRVLPDKRTKYEILEALDRAEDLYSATKDTNTALADRTTELHDQIQHKEAVEDDLREQLGRMQQQRNQLLDAIEDFQLADQEAEIKNQQRDVAYARMGDLHTELGCERSNEMVQPIPRESLLFSHNKGDGHWRQHKGAGI